MTEQSITDDELRILADSARDYAAGSSALAQLRALRGSDPGYEADALARMAAMGWTGITVPQRCGGLGLGLQAAGAVLQALGAKLAAEPLIDLALLPAALLSRLPAGPAIDDLLAAVGRGERASALAWSESHRPDPALAWGVRAEPVASGHLLHGRKRFVAAAPGGWLVSASTPQGPALLHVSVDAPGVVRNTSARVDGVASSTLEFAGAPARLLAAGDGVAPALEDALDDAALLSCAEMLGIMETALQTTLHYIRTRVQFGQPVASFQAVQHRMVDLHILQQVAISACAAGLRVADSVHASRSERALAVNQAKARCSDAVLRITQDAVQYHGAIGFTDECDVGLYLKRALVLAPAFGNAVFHRARFRACQRAILHGSSDHAAV